MIMPLAKVGRVSLFIQTHLQMAVVQQSIPVFFRALPSPDRSHRSLCPCQQTYGSWHVGSHPNIGMLRSRQVIFGQGSHMCLVETKCTIPISLKF